MAYDIDEQHPKNANGLRAAHCVCCGVYVDDLPNPPMDFLCGECEAEPVIDDDGAECCAGCGRLTRA